MNTSTKPLISLCALLLAAALASPVRAAGSHADHDHSTPEGMAQHMQMMQSDGHTSAGAHQAEGLVRKIDAAQGKITLRHGATPDMPAMTMIYRVKDKAMLDGLKPGDTVLFSAEKIDGYDTVTSISRKP
ncbi:MAG: copper-binding protein [Thiomonas sp.]|jgi:Cu/Ag efflux protein CusF